jgi:hypothetical protein
MVATALSTFTADETAAMFARKIRRREQFVFLRYGDGALECINGLGRGKTCDGEKYSDILGVQLLYAWDRILTEGGNVYVGDWLSASFQAHDKTQYAEEYMRLIGTHAPKFVHFEALLLMRESKELLDFYRAVRTDPRRKIFTGPAECEPAAELMGARFLQVPMTGLFEEVQHITEILMAQSFDVLLWGAGMASSIVVANLVEQHPERTYINIGSAMDPLFRGKTRARQLTQRQARELFADLL